MILKNQIITNIKIESVNDLYKLKPFLEDGTLKVNKSQIARELDVDRRTVTKYLEGYQKPKTRKSSDCITPFYDIIADLLSDDNQQVFYYRKVLWQYLVDNHNYSGAYCNFCFYLKKYKEFDSYFRKSCSSNTAQVTVRYETDMGRQAQLDWKESIPFILSTGETIEVNIFVLLLSFSRYRIYKVSLTKTQDILFSFLDEAFETFGGVPEEVLTDNMKTVMDEARTEYSQGKVNIKFQQFADDYGFHVHPCIAGRPQTKAKVEAAVAAAIAADPTLKGVTVTYDITKVNATTDAEGSIKGKVVITSGDVAKEVAVSFVIEKLPVHQHDFIWVIVKDATDTTKGEMKGTCSCGKTTTSDDASGKVTVESDKDNDFKAQLKDNEDVKGKIELTQDEQDAIIAGEDLEIILKLEDTTVEVDTAEKEDIAEKLAEKEFEGKKLGTFLDINLIKKIGNTETKVTNTTGMLKLTFEVPASLINKDAAINRTYTIARNHEGKVEFLKAEFNKETNQLTFETDKFSTYAVIYEDTAVVPEAPKTADATNFMPILALLFAGLGMVVVGKKKRA